MNTIPRIFLVVAEQDTPDDSGRRIYSVHRSQSGLTTTLRRQHSGEAVARATGGGYDLEGTVLADGLSAEFGLPSFDGAVGVSSVIVWAEGHGLAVYPLSEALYALPRVSDR
jgi:hypothetical protein